jgi:hypothetical protein
MLFRSAFLLAFLLTSLFIKAQSTFDIRGNVKDQAGKPLVGVTIFIKLLERGTQTKTGGNFTLTGIPNGTQSAGSTVTWL